MTSRLAAALIVLGSACVALPLASAQPDAEVVKEEAVKLPLGEDYWDMRPLEQEPVKLVKFTAVKRQIRLPEFGPKPEKPAKTREQTSVQFVLEFTRDLTVRDTDWTGVRPQPPFRFDFLDRDGVTLFTQLATYDGIPVGRKGRRVRLVLTLPPPGVMARTHKVAIELRRAGDSP